MAFYIILLATIVNGWIFPDPLFVHNLAMKFERNGLIFHLPNLSLGNTAGYLEK